MVRFCLYPLAFALGCLMALSARADHWSVEKMNDAINQTNFIVDSGCSGTLISLKHRLILTNHHCIGRGVRYVDKERVGKDGVVRKVKVEELFDLPVAQRQYVNYRLVGESSWKTTIVARWKESDLALLQIRADIPHTIEATVFPGEVVHRGEPVFLVGNPLGLDATVTAGVISSTNRMFRVSWADAEVPFIQVDAGIAGGNSGGSLYNAHGQLIGVPAARAQDGHLGLAIPFFQVQKFLDEHCYGEVWRKDAEPRDACLAAKEQSEEDEDK